LRVLLQLDCKILILSTKFDTSAAGVQAFLNLQCWRQGLVIKFGTLKVAWWF